MLHLFHKVHKRRERGTDCSLAILLVTSTRPRRGCKRRTVVQRTPWQLGGEEPPSVNVLLRLGVDSSPSKWRPSCFFIPGAAEMDDDTDSKSTKDVFGVDEKHT